MIAIPDLIDAGIDVSDWQGGIDWEQVAASGILFAIIKATEGTRHVQCLLRANAKGAHRAGLHLGYYHFFRAGADGGEQAAHYRKAIADLPAPTLPHMLDLEQKGSEAPALGVEAYTRQAEQWCETVGDAMVYTSHKERRQLLLPDHGLGGWPLAAPSYGTNDGRRHEPPKVAEGWTDWTVWQYTSRGRVAGIEGNVDRWAGRRVFLLNRTLPVL